MAIARCSQRLCLVVSEGLQHVRRNLAAIGRATYANASARKAVRAQTLCERAQAIVPRSAAASLDGNFSDSALKVVMNN